MEIREERQRWKKKLCEFYENLYNDADGLNAHDTGRSLACLWLDTRINLVYISELNENRK